jgi:transposase
VDDAGRNDLRAAVEQDPRALGLPFSVWTCANLARDLAQKGHALVAEETIRRHLHDLGYRLLRPVLRINSPDPDYAVKLQQLEQLKVQARQGQLTLLFEDEVDLNLLPGIIGCWTLRGGQRKVPTPGQNQKCFGFGAVNFVTGQLTRLVYEHKNSDGFCALLDQIVQHYCPGEHWSGPKVTLVIDNYIIHRSQKSERILANYADRLSVMALPTYSPHLNVIERLWKHLRRQVTHNHLFASLTQLVEAVEQFFGHLDQHPAEVLSVIGCSG